MTTVTTTKRSSRPTATRSNPAVLQGYFSRYDGIDHAEHSVSEEAYEAWVRVRLGDLATACGVDGREAERVIDALRDSDRGPMVAYPEAGATLSSLREAGLAVGVCSNWGWELDGFLREVGLLHLVDAGVTSARAGARKPHPGIYARPSSRSTSTRGRFSSSVTRGSPTSGGRAATAWPPCTSGGRRSGGDSVPRPSSPATTVSGS